MDRIVRIIIGVVILVAGYLYGSWWGLLGLIPLLTGIIGWCGIYSVLHISTDHQKGTQ